MVSLDSSGACIHKLWHCQSGAHDKDIEIKICHGANQEDFAPATVKAATITGIDRPRKYDERLNAFRLN
jgi:hypothetical protein